MAVFGGRRVTVLLAAVAVALVGGVAGLVFASQPRAQTSPSPPPCSPGTLVQTGSGPVCGVTASGQTSYLGIRYAAPPVGNLRWMPPQPVQPWTSTYQATQSGPGVFLTGLPRWVSAAGRHE
jgi:para-nitrobenzyl esterase